MSKPPSRRKTRAPLFEELERRILLSADAIPLADMATLDGAEPAVQGQLLEPEADPGPADTQSRTELVFVDTGVEGYEALVDDLRSSASEGRTLEVFLLDGERDGIEQITDILADYQGIDAIHVVSHGSEGTAQLGNAWLSDDTLSSYEGALQSWGASLSEDADLLFYGCDLAGGASGEALVGQVAKLTGADVAASDDLTGAGALGGDWTLEISTGAIETSGAFSVEMRQSWEGVLEAIAVDSVDDTVDAVPGDGLAEDAAGDTTLRAAVMEANALAGADTIHLGSGTYSLDLGEITISSDLTITGAGVGVTIIDGASLDRIFAVTSGTVTISGVTIQGGNVSGSGDGGAIDIASGADVTLTNVELLGNTADDGGAIANAGTLSLTDVTIDGNKAANNGGGLFNTGTASLNRVTISANDADGEGGGVFNDGVSFSATNVTISGNAANRGGGFYQFNSNPATLQNATITDNSGVTRAGGIEVRGDALLSLGNSILSGNFAPSEADINGTITSLGNNLITNSADGGGYIGSDILDIAPMLGALADNGGSTQTHALLTGSRGIDEGDNGQASLADQRGYARGASVDIGAFEYAAIPNAAPVADAGGAYMIDEGEGLLLDASGTFDLDGDALTYRWDLDADGSYDLTTSSPTVGVNWATLASYGIDDDGGYEIGLQVEDALGITATSASKLIVSNVAPVITATGAASVVEGGVFTLDLGAFDPGNDTVASWTIDWGDGTTQTIVGNPSSVDHVYSGAGHTYNILVAATDEDGVQLQNDLLVPGYGTDDIHRFDANTGTHLGQFGSLGDGLDDPYELVVGPDGNIYVSGTNSNSVLRYTADGTFIDEFVSTGSGGLSEPIGLAFGPDGNLYVSSYNTAEILRFDGATGAPLGSFASNPSLAGPMAMTFGADGNLYVAGFESHNVVRFDGATGAFIDVFVTSGSGGLSSPEDLTFGPDGNLYVTSPTSNSVLRFDGTSGASLGTFASGGGLSGATGLAFAPDGLLYVASYHTDDVVRFDATTGAYVDTLFASGSGGIDGPTYLNFAPSHQVEVFLNQPPVAVADTASVAEGGSVTIDLTANDSDPNDGLDLTSIVIVSGPANGTLVVNGDGTVTYSHDGSETTSDSFSYTIDGAVGVSEATVVSITVNPENDVPALVITSDPATYLEEGAPVAIAPGLNLTDADGHDGTNPSDQYVAAVTITGNYEVGDILGFANTANIEATQTGNLLVFSVVAGQTATVADFENALRSVTFSSSLDDPSVLDRTIGFVFDDGVDSPLPVTTQVLITSVNDAPVQTAGTVDDLVVAEDSGLTSLGLGGLAYGPGGGVDEAGQTLTYQITVIPHPGNFGTIYLADGTTQVTTGFYTLTELQGMQFEPVPDASGGPSFFEFRVYDDGGVANGGTDLTSESIQITITPVNDAPTAVPDSATVDEGASVAIDLAANDTDLDDAIDLTSIVITSPPTNGTLVVNNDGTVTYTHNGSETTTDSFTYTIQDASGAVSNSATVSLTVAPTNDDPTNVGSLPAAVTVTEDQSSPVDLSAIDLSDVDAGNQLVTIMLTTSTGGLLYSGTDLDVTVSGSGTGTLWLTGSVSGLNQYLDAPGLILYQHGTAHTAGDGVDTIQVDVRDNGNTGTGGGGTITLGTVNVDITPVNDAPVLTSGTIDDLVVVEDSGLTSLGLDDLLYGPGGGTDELSQDLTVEITVIPDSNAFGTIYLADGTTQVTTGKYTLAELQGMQFQPAANESGGPSFFSFRIYDDGGTANGGADFLSESMQISITPENDAPTAVPDSAIVDEGNAVVINLAGNDTDLDDALDLTSIVITSAPANGTLVVNNDGTVTYTHNGSETTTDSFTYTIQDASGAISNGATVSLTVNPVNDAPTAAPDSAIVDEGSSVVINLAANDTDLDDTIDLTSIVITSAPANGTLVVNNDGTVTYTHNGSETTTDSFTYTIQDASGAISNGATVSLTVNSANDPPTAVPDTANVDEGH